MTAVDTNVIVRLLTQDNEAQYKRALAVFNRKIVYIPDTVWLESEWVLRYAYGFDVRDILKAFRTLLGLQQVRVNDTIRILSALDWHEAGLDFADAMHLAASQDSESFLTFDRDFVKKAADLGACRVAEAP